MARKGERYQQVPTLWHIGWGYPCRVMRRRRVWITRKDGTRRKQWAWVNCYHDVLTLATARRWKRLEAQGKAIIRRDVQEEFAIQMGIVRVPPRATWAGVVKRAESGVLA